MAMLDIDCKNSIYYIYLNRPEVKNSFNPDLIAEILEAVNTIPTEARALILQGRGSVFCSGADLSWMKSMVQYTESQNVKDAEKLFEMFNQIRLCPIPVITVVHGAAFGGALGFLGVSDVVICEAQAQLCFSEVKLGLVPAVISSFVSLRSNMGQLRPWMISGKSLSVEEAHRLGLVDQIYQGDVSLGLKDWVQCFQEAGPAAVKATKNLLARSFEDSFWQQRKKLTTELIARVRVSSEGQEGLQAFISKRRASWQ